MTTHHARLLGLSVAGIAMLAGADACSRRAEEEVEVVVRQIALDPGSHSPVVLLEDKRHTIALPIWIGAAEARAIAMRLEGVESPRPLTHDLMKNMLEGVGVTLRKVVIGALRDDTYFASIVLSRKGEEVAIDSRPSDAIALAVRFGQPIFVSAQLLQAKTAIRLDDIAAADVVTFGGVTVQRLSDDLADHFDLPPGQGVLVADVAGDARGSLLRGDVILEIDGDPVRDPQEFRRLIARSERPTLAVHRGGKRVAVALDSSRG
jgi:uncharacterized protein